MILSYLLDQLRSAALVNEKTHQLSLARQSLDSENFNQIVKQVLFLFNYSHCFLFLRNTALETQAEIARRPDFQRNLPLSPYRHSCASEGPFASSRIAQAGQELHRQLIFRLK